MTLNVGELRQPTPDLISLQSAARSLGIGYTTLRGYVKELGLQAQHLRFDKNAYLTRDDVRVIAEVREAAKARKQNLL